MAPNDSRDRIVGVKRHLRIQTPARDLVRGAQPSPPARIRAYASQTMTQTSALRITRATNDDLAFVGHSWLQSYAETFRPNRQCSHCYAMPDAAYRPWQRGRIRSIMGDGAAVFVARDPESMAYIHGWLCAARDGDALVLHFAYVKGARRREGVFSGLLAAALDELGGEQLAYTHRTRFDSKLESLGFRYRSVERVGRREVA